VLKSHVERKIKLFGSEEMDDLKEVKLPKEVLNCIKLSPNERVLLCVKGAFKEWLVCTIHQVYIVKRGYMTGHTFGSNAYQMPYKNIAGANVNYHLFSGYFEISSGGMQNTSKSYWSGNSKSDPAKAPNCISLNTKKLANKFREACTFINIKTSEISNSEAINITQTDTASQLEKYSNLLNKGDISQEEYNKLKANLLENI